MMLLRNDSDEEVVIEGISLAYKDVGLSGFARPPSDRRAQAGASFATMENKSAGNHPLTLCRP
jgi:hypothetical protein